MAVLAALFHAQRHDYRKRTLLGLFLKKLYSSGKTQAYTQALHQLKFKTMAYPHGPATLLYSRHGLSAGSELLMSLTLEHWIS